MNRRHRFPAEIIQHAIWLYARFTLSYRDVEELPAERGLDISYETVRRLVLKFGPAIARRLRRRRPRPSDRWHLVGMSPRAADPRRFPKSPPKYWIIVHRDLRRAACVRAVIDWMKALFAEQREVLAGVSEESPIR